MTLDNANRVINGYTHIEWIHPSMAKTVFLFPGSPPAIWKESSFIGSSENISVQFLFLVPLTDERTSHILLGALLGNHSILHNTEETYADHFYPCSMKINFSATGIKLAFPLLCLKEKKVSKSKK